MTSNDVIWRAILDLLFWISVDISFHGKTNQATYDMRTNSWIAATRWRKLEKKQNKMMSIAKIDYNMTT